MIIMSKNTVGKRLLLLLLLLIKFLTHFMTFEPKGNKTALNFYPTCSFSLFTLSSSVFKLEKDAVCWKTKKSKVTCFALVSAWLVLL